MMTAMIDLGDVVRAARELAPLPASATRLARLVENPDVGVDEVAEVVAFDQALTLKMLRLANSAASGSGIEITTVQEAVSRMGTTEVVAFAVAAHAGAMLAAALPGYGLGEDQLWRHSVLSALVIDALARARARALPPEAFTAALLHDIGKLVLNRFLTPDIIDLMRRAQTEGSLSPYEAESEIIQVHHAEVGALVTQHWSLPPRIVNAIQYHHDPTRGNDLLCDLVHAADVVAHRMERSQDEGQPDGAGIELEMDEAAGERLAWGEVDLAGLIERVQSRFRDVGQRYKPA